MKNSKTRHLAIASLLLLLPLSAAACSDDTNDSVETAAGNVASDASDALDNAGDELSSAASDAGNAIDSVVSDGTGPEGQAKTLAMAMAANLTAMPGGGEATVANLEAAAKLVPSPDKVTGIEDSDGNGIDDDAKATIETNNGDDKACVQSQDGVWEVTDDEC